MDKFLLAQNPLRPADHSLYIIHMLSPVVIIECKKEDIAIQREGIIFEHFSFKNTEDIIESWTLSIFYIDSHETEEQQGRHILKRAWHWFRAYLEK